MGSLRDWQPDKQAIRGRPPSLANSALMRSPRTLPGSSCDAHQGSAQVIPLGLLTLRQRGTIASPVGNPRPSSGLHPHVHLYRFLLATLTHSM